MRIIRVRQPILNSQFSTLNSKFPMDTGYLIILAVIAVVCLFFARRKKNSSSGTFKELTKSPAQPVILIHDIDKETLKEAYDRFSDISEQEVTSIEPEDNGFRLTFTPETDYIAFCYWVNYLVYSLGQLPRLFRRGEAETLLRLWLVPLRRSGNQRREAALQQPDCHDVCR